MSRYIDINRLEPQQFENSEAELGVLAYDYEVVQSEPYIDIVRCGECKNHKPSTIWAETKPCIVEPFPSIRCKMLNREVNVDDFCSYGEREEK